MADGATYLVRSRPITTLHDLSEPEYDVDQAFPRIIERHSCGDELSRIYLDVLCTGHELGVNMPVLGAPRPIVDTMLTKAVWNAAE